jgi:hypothetical protein
MNEIINKNDTNPADLNWLELSAYINNLLGTFDQRAIRILEETEKDPITTSIIEKRVKEGWRVKEEAHIAPYGTCNRELKLILISFASLKNPYDFHKTLFHELVHLQYGKLLDSGELVYDNSLSAREDWSIMESFAEWIGRNLRANPTLLKKATNVFRLKPTIYDLSSYNALFVSGSLKNNNGQLELFTKYRKKYYESLGIFMD